MIIMSIEVFCDDCHLGEYDNMDNAKAKNDFVKALKKRGWEINTKTGKVYCPDCVKTSIVRMIEKGVIK